MHCIADVLFWNCSKIFFLHSFDAVKNNGIHTLTKAVTAAFHCDWHLALLRLGLVKVFWLPHQLYILISAL